MRPFHHVSVFLATAIIAASGLVSCKKDEPTQPHISAIQLTVEDTSCTEAWLKVSLTDANQPRTVAIRQDGQRVLIANLVASDSVLVVEGLLPRHTYSFVAQRLRDSIAIDASTSVGVTTMDTTSHDFTWQLDTLGDASSVLYDIAIVNDTLAYAVGEMYLRDSTGQTDPTRYNVAIWNGNAWSIRRIPYNFWGQQFFHPIQSVFAFNANDIWFCGNGIIRWNGTAYTEVPVPPSVWGAFRMNRIWGSSSVDLYVVGDGGSIAHYSNNTWQRVESGTTLEVSDIYGAWNQKSRQWEILAAAGNPFSGPERAILQITGSTVTMLPDSGSIEPSAGYGSHRGNGTGLLEMESGTASQHPIDGRTEAVYGRRSI